MKQRSLVKAPPVEQAALAAWKLPLIVAAIAVSIVAGFYIGGPGLGMAVGALAASSIIVMAVRNPPCYPIVPAVLLDLRRHLLIVISEALEDTRAIDQIARAADGPDVDQAAEVVVLASAHQSFLNRWTSDFGPAHQRAERCLVVSLASLAKAGISARARMGDEDLVQAVEDELRTFPATEVFLVTGDPEGDTIGNAAAAQLESRLQVEFHHLVIGSQSNGSRTSNPARFAPHTEDPYPALIT